jgi:hypothetical protein
MADYLRKYRPEIENPEAYAEELTNGSNAPGIGVPATAGKGGFTL